MKVLAQILIPILLTMSASAQAGPGDTAVTQCVERQLKVQHPLLNSLVFAKVVSTFITNDKNFDYIFQVKNSEGQTGRVFVYVRDGDMKNATVSVDLMFPSNLDISSCY
ncbi:MAG: hypothetical protein EOP06_11955 [Proteobacteria bacterium]|nr:MAG: hypothetical protein EOP06_11955 [Pseudomonadota bacterium]